MLTNNISLNSLSNHHSPYFNGSSNNTSFFTGRSVKNWTDDDPARHKILEEIMKDGGKSMIRKLVRRIVPIPKVTKSLISATTSKNATRTVDPGHFGQPYLGRKPLKAISNYVYTVDRNERTKHLNKGEFIRVGMTEPGLLFETLFKKDVTYKFGGNRSLLGKRIDAQRDNIELSNCFYPREDFNGTDVFKNLEIYQYKWATASAMNLCKGIGKKAFSGEFDINIDMKKADNFTFLRMIPHGEWNRYMDQSNKIHALPLPPNSTEMRVARLNNQGMRFENSGATPLAMKVEKHDGKHYFIVEQRADYSSFKLPENACEMPFEGVNTPLDKAVCCKDGTMQKQDVKYLHVEELKNNTMFNVKFSVNFADFYKESAVGLPLTTVAVNDKLVARSHGWVGNNNNDNSSEPLGYHVQFGINDANDDTVVVKIRNPKFYPDQVLDLDKLADQKNMPIVKINGECQRPPMIEAIKHRHLYQGPEVITYDKKFARVGMQSPELLTEQFTKDGSVIYTFKDLPMNKTAEIEKNVELTNCFFDASSSGRKIGESSVGSTERGQLKIATGQYLVECPDSSKEFYGEFDLKVDMGGKPGNVTVFRFLPHNSGVDYVRPDGYKGFLPARAGISKYLEMKNNGVVFSAPGDSPLTMNIEYNGGEHFFTVKTRSNYAGFKNPSNPRCDIPFQGKNTPLGVATCCNDPIDDNMKGLKDFEYDSIYQEEDVKYIHVSPLERGWFNVKFYAEFSKYNNLNYPGNLTGIVALSINDKSSVANGKGLGNNNFYATTNKVKYYGGYYSQFGLFDASHESITVQVKDPHIESDVSIDLIESPVWKDIISKGKGKEILTITGECRSNKK